MLKDNKDDQRGQISDNARRRFLKFASAGAIVGSGLPASSSIVSGKQTGTVVLNQDFEDLPVGSYPDGWEKDGNENQKVIDDFAASGSKSLQLSGSPGGCWQAVANAPLVFPTDGQISLNFAIRPTSSGSYGCHKYRARIQARTDVGTWGAGQSLTLVQFESDGTVTAHSETVGEYTADEWHLITYTYTRDQTSSGDSITAKVSLSQPSETATSTVTVNRSPTEFENNLQYLTFRSGDFTTQIDSIQAEKTDKQDTEPKFEIQNSRLVQTVENTRIDENTRAIVAPGTTEGYGSNAQLTVGRKVAPLFDIVGTNLESITEPVSVNVTRKFTDGRMLSDEFALKPKFIREIAKENAPPTLLGALAGFRKLADGGSYSIGRKLVWTLEEEGGYIGIKREQDGMIVDFVTDTDEDGVVSFETESLAEGEFIVFYKDTEVATFELTESIEVPPWSEIISSGSYPVFEVTEDLTDLIIEVGGRRQRIKLSDDLFVDSADINIGVTRVRAPLRYGTVSDREYEARIRQIASFLQRALPLSRVNIYQGSESIYGLWSDNADLQSAYDHLQGQLPVETGDSSGMIITAADGHLSFPDEMEIDEFDATLLLTPDQYFDYHGQPATSGVESIYCIDENSDGKPDLQPYTAAAAEISANTAVAAMELTHHFLNYPYSDEFARIGDGACDFTNSKYDRAHTRRKTTSTKFDLEDGSFEVDTQINSYMSYATGSRWVDQPTRQALINNGFDPDPKEGDQNSWIGDLLSVTASITDENETQIHRFEKTSGDQITPSIESGSLEVQTYNIRGDTVDIRRLPTTIGRSHHGDSSTIDNIVLAHIPFPEEAFKIQFSIEEVTTRVNPITESLFKAIELIPDDGFKHPDRRRKALNNKLDAVERQLDQKAIRAARQKLKKDFKAAVERWLKDDYETAANQYTKEEIHQLTDEMVARLDTIGKERAQATTENSPK